MPLSSRGFQVGAMPTSGALDPRMFLDARAVQPNVAGRTALAAFLAAKKRQMDEAQQTKENEFTDRRLKVQEGQEERLAESAKLGNEIAQIELGILKDPENQELKRQRAILENQRLRLQNNAMEEAAKPQPLPFSRGVNRVYDPENQDNFVFVEPITGEVLTRDKFEPASKDDFNVDLSDIGQYRIGDSNAYMLPTAPGKYEVVVDIDPETPGAQLGRLPSRHISVGDKDDAPKFKIGQRYISVNQAQYDELLDYEATLLEQYNDYNNPDAPTMDQIEQMLLKRANELRRGKREEGKTGSDTIDFSSINTGSLNAKELEAYKWLKENTDHPKAKQVYERLTNR